MQGDLSFIHDNQDLTEYRPDAGLLLLGGSKSPQKHQAKIANYKNGLRKAHSIAFPPDLKKYHNMVNRPKETFLPNII
jgi:hypothetical protein